MTMGPTARQLSMSWQGRDIGKERERNRKRTTGFSLTSHVFGCVVRVSNAQVSNDIAREKEETHSPPKLMMLNVQRLAHPSLSDASHSPIHSFSPGHTQTKSGGNQIPLKESRKKTEESDILIGHRLFQLVALRSRK